MSRKTGNKHSKDKGKRHRKPLFDVIIGNPPYQEETAIKDTKNGQKTVRNIFQEFQTGAEEVAETTCLIYPGQRWMHQSGKSMKSFGKQQINDPHLRRVVYYPDASEVFDNVGIAGGVSIVLKDMKQDEDTFEYTYSLHGEEVTVTLKHPGDELIPLDPRDAPIVAKIRAFVEREHLAFISDRILSIMVFGIGSDFVENNPTLVEPYTGQAFDPSKYCKLLTNDSAGKAGRAAWYLASLSVIPRSRDLIHEWQVIVSSANPGGQKRGQQLQIVDDQSAFGRSRLGLGTFKTKAEAENFYNYVSSEVIRYCFLLTDENLSSLARLVPDVNDYTDGNGLIDFNGDMDEQLSELLGLTDEELCYVRDKAKTQHR